MNGPFLWEFLCLAGYISFRANPLEDIIVVNRMIRIAVSDNIMILSTNYGNVFLLLYS
jgi:hypothetical protein